MALGSLRQPACWPLPQAAHSTHTPPQPPAPPPPLDAIVDSVASRTQCGGCAVCAVWATTHGKGGGRTDRRQSNASTRVGVRGAPCPRPPSCACHCHKNANTNKPDTKSHLWGAGRGAARLLGATDTVRECTVRPAATTGGVPADCAVQPALPYASTTRFHINSSASETTESCVQFGTDKYACLNRPHSTKHAPLRLCRLCAALGHTYGCARQVGLCSSVDHACMHAAMRLCDHTGLAARRCVADSHERVSSHAAARPTFLRGCLTASAQKPAWSSFHGS